MPLRKLYLELTSACNLDCAICYRRAWTAAPADLRPELLDRVIDSAGRMQSLRTIVLGGIGEPTSAPLFGRAIASFPAQELIVTTNGVALSESVLRSLAKYAATVVFSVDGLNETFRKIRGTELSTVLDSVRWLLALRAEAGTATPRAEFQFVLSRDNAGDLPDVIDLAAEAGVSVVVVSQLLPQDTAGASKVMYGRYAMNETAALFDRVRARAMRRGTTVLLPPIELKTERRCAFAEDGAVFVNANGDVVPCYRFSHDGTEYVLGREKRVYKHSFGNLAEEPLATIWESPAYEGFRKTLLEHRYPSCPDCYFLSGCNMAADSTADCWSGSPSCADCLWARGFLRCP